MLDTFDGSGQDIRNIREFSACGIGLNTSTRGAADSLIGGIGDEAPM